jgi:hypothetical protein
MTGPENSQNGTRPISVAELLAKNGTIGAPPVGGRRRRRRGNSDAVTVAELTGEIPVVHTGEIPVVATDNATDEPDTDEPEAEEPEAEEPGSVVVTEQPEDRPTPHGADNGQRNGTDRNGNDSAASAALEIAERESTPHVPPEPAPKPLPRRGREGTPERSHYPRPLRKTERGPVDRPRSERAAGAELMSPDPIDVDDSPELQLDLDIELDSTDDVDVSATRVDTDVEPDELGIGDASYLRSTSGTLFGGQTVADDLARRGTDDELVGDDVEVAEALEDEDYDEPSRAQAAARAGWIVLQSVFAVAFGAGLFVAFDQLWKWNSIVALVLGVLVILGLVVGVRVVRKTEDIGSTLTAVAVGALVTFGPLALLQAN